METLIMIYISIASATAIFTILDDEGVEGVDNIWDWIIYNLFWIVQPIKAIYKLIKNVFKNDKV